MKFIHTSNDIRVPTPISKFDERDTMFARAARTINTSTYEEYYSNNPNLKKKDDHIRSLTPLLQPGSKYYNDPLTIEAKQLFKSIDEIFIEKSTLDKYIKLFNNKINYTEVIKSILIELGAVAVGCTELDQNFIYSHKGRFDSNYGLPIKLDHPNAILFLVEMDYANMQQAPTAKIIYESAQQYYKAAYISKVIEKLILSLGYHSKAHFDANYDIILPPLAIKAGLGELGRNNILITDKFGSRVRIGAITTNLNIQFDKPVNLGVEKFCTVCKKCSDNCPARALSSKEKTNVRGVEKWTTNVENCYTLWRKYGTDCGICMASCPFSHKNNLFHNIVRRSISLFPFLSRLLFNFDNLIYGKVWKNN